jgi:hypothetical protein
MKSNLRKHPKLTSLMSETLSNKGLVGDCLVENNTIMTRYSYQTKHQGLKSIAIHFDNYNKFNFEWVCNRFIEEFSNENT